jgi:hypothetical protein
VLDDHTACDRQTALDRKEDMKKKTKSEKTPKVRLSREAIRLLSGSQLDEAAGGRLPVECPWESCEGGATTCTKPPGR